MDIIINVTDRPWGYYIKFLQEEGVWVKRVEVFPQSRLSLQKHEKRSEKWNIVSGEGKVQLDDHEFAVTGGDVIDIPIGVQHRIANTSEDKKLVFIEVACGKYLAEDDIIRIQDDYADKRDT
jgi:mannose-6-phosphate isomerase-like protein (cupin superfamily)